MPVTSDGRVVPLDVRPGIGINDLLTMPGDELSHPEMIGGNDAVQTSAAATDKPKVNYLWYILGVAVFLVLIRISESKIHGSQPAVLGVGIYNMVVVGTMALLWIVVVKVILNKYHVSGLSEIASIA
jgi:hypothetical protein